MKHIINIQIEAKDSIEANLKAKYIEKMMPYLSVESLKTLASKAGPGTNKKISTYKSFL
jgi:hypothetical protein